MQKILFSSSFWYGWDIKMCTKIILFLISSNEKSLNELEIQGWANDWHQNFAINQHYSNQKKEYCALTPEFQNVKGFSLS